MSAILIFACSFGVVLALGLQQLNVSGGHRAAAFVTSLAIAGFNLVLFKLVPQPTGLLETAGYLLGGPFGILAAMRWHPVLVRWARRKHRLPPLVGWNDRESATLADVHVELGRRPDDDRRMTTVLMLLVRPEYLITDESGAHPGEKFYGLRLPREQLHELVRIADDDWEMHMKACGTDRFGEPDKATT